MASDFQLLPTPSPEEFSFSVRVPDRKFNTSLLLKTGSTLVSAQTAARTGGTATTYSEFLWAVNQERVSEFADYVYLKCEKSGADYINFFFGKARTDEERNTPFAVYRDNRQFTWDAVLEDLYIIQSSVAQYINTGSATDTAPRYLPRYKYRPAVSYNSRIIVRQYLSEIPWPDEALEHEQPVPTAINADYIGMNINFERCLHGACRFRETTPGATPVVGIGMIDPPSDRSLLGQLFPATNFTDWADFFIEDRQQQVNGLWLRESVQIFPPTPPESIIR
jgi:hypothetical protein